jgi:hypothetical protein
MPSNEELRHQWVSLFQILPKKKSAPSKNDNDATQIVTDKNPFLPLPF